MKPKKTKEITKEIKFSELLEKYPESVEILFKSGMHCFGCAMASFETLEQGALAHGIEPEKLVKEINEMLNKKDSKKPRSKKNVQ